MSTGRPLKFKTVKELEAKIEAYFNSCFDIRYLTKKDGSPIFDKDDLPAFEKRQVKPFTVTGLAVFLDTTRQTLLEYQGEVEGRQKANPGYADAITRAKTRIEAYADENLFTPQIATGVIFNLTNNFGWRDTKHNLHDVEGTLASLMRDAEEKPNSKKK